MDENLIYKSWKLLTPDLRYLRQERWEVIKETILIYNLKTVIEFGSGISTILFSNLNLNILSFETSLNYIAFMANLCPKAVIIFWNNKSLALRGNFDLALVDGTLPRDLQLDISIKRASFIAIDDYTDDIKDSLSPKLTNLKRIDKNTTPLAMFDNRQQVTGLIEN